MKKFVYKSLILLIMILCYNISNGQDIKYDNKTTIAYVIGVNDLPSGFGLYQQIKNSRFGWYLTYRFGNDNASINEINSNIPSTYQNNSIYDWKSNKEIIDIGATYYIDNIISTYYGVGYLINKLNSDKTNSYYCNEWSYNFGIIIHSDNNIAFIFGYNTNIDNVNLGIGYTF